MNLYGQEARDYWRKNAPSRYAAIEDPETFFEELGEQVAQQVLTLMPSFEGTAPANEEYLATVARLNSARRSAEELVKAELVWVTPELNDVELREEWEQTRPMDDSLLTWAMRFQGDEGPWDELAETAATWMLPESFLEELARSENPAKLFYASEPLLKSAADKRFARWVANQQNDPQ